MHIGKENCCIAGIVSRCRIILFVGSFVFFVNNDQAQIIKRQKRCRPGPQHHFVLIIQHLLPNLNTFVIIKPRVVNANICTEIHPEPAFDNMRGERQISVASTIPVFAVGDHLFDQHLMYTCGFARDEVTPCSKTTSFLLKLLANVF